MLASLFGCSIYDDELLAAAQDRGGSLIVVDHCNNRSLDADESDVDCGGFDCVPCGRDRTCEAGADCENDSCVLGLCQWPSCTDSVENSTETDVDCGGANCSSCPPGLGCEDSDDCDSGLCRGGVCAEPSCVDRVQNGGESDVDCGGACDRLCEPGESCVTAFDCASPSARSADLPTCSDSVCVLYCASTAADCNGRATDGCEQQLDVDTNHCGACDRECAFSRVNEHACILGECAIASCLTGFSDCNGLPEDGCETETGSDADHCGACFASCSEAGGSSLCEQGRCTIQCSSGFGDCDEDARFNGCETDLTRSAQRCGSCDGACPTSQEGEVAFCKESVCGATVCDKGLGDCDGDGQCADLLTSKTDCGACGLSCNLSFGVATCEAGSCVIEQCPADRNDCDLLYATGCESNPNGDVDNCGACGVICGATGENASGAACVDGACIVACQAGFCSGNTVEAACSESLGTSSNCLSCGHTCAPGERCTTLGCSLYEPVVITAQKDFLGSVEDGWKTAGTYTLSELGTTRRALLLFAATTSNGPAMDARLSWGSTERHLEKLVTHRLQAAEAGVFALVHDELPPPGTTVTLAYWATGWWGGFVGTLLEAENVDQSDPKATGFTASSESCAVNVRATAQLQKPGSLIATALNVSYGSNRDGSPFGLNEINDAYQSSQANGLFGVLPLAMGTTVVGWDVQTCWRWALAGVVINPAPF